MLENQIPPTMRITKSGSISWVGDDTSMVQATADIAIPNSDGLLVLQASQAILCNLQDCLVVVPNH